MPEKVQTTCTFNLTWYFQINLKSMGIVKENNLVDNLYKGNCKYIFLINIIIVYVIKYYFIS